MYSACARVERRCSWTCDTAPGPSAVGRAVSGGAAATAMVSGHDGFRTGLAKREELHRGERPKASPAAVPPHEPANEAGILESLASIAGDGTEVAAHVPSFAMDPSRNGCAGRSRDSCRGAGLEGGAEIE
jgi:hypothetical protein